MSTQAIEIIYRMIEESKDGTIKCNTRQSILIEVKERISLLKHRRKLTSIQNNTLEAYERLYKNKWKHPTYRELWYELNIDRTTAYRTLKAAIESRDEIASNYSENKYQIAKEVLQEYYVDDCNTNSGIIPDDWKVWFEEWIEEKALPTKI